MQASLAVAGLLAAVGRGFRVAESSCWLVAWCDPALDEGSLRSAALLNQWNKLHAVRSVAGFCAFVILLLQLTRLL